MKLKGIFTGALLITLLVRCGGVGSESTSNTESGTSSSTVSSQIKEIAGSLIPEMSATSSSNLSKFVSFADDDDWSTYLEEDNQVYLTDIFGGTDGVAPVTRIRVLLDQFENDYSQITSLDPDFTCTDSDYVSSLSPSLEVEIPFLSNVANTSLDDQALDCVINVPDSNSTILYGRDDAGVTRIISMSESTSTNTQSVETRGDRVKLMQVVKVTVADQETDGVNRAYLDLHYAQATVYSGATDDTFNTSDDIVFKSRSRITGTVQLDEDGAPVDNTALGEYTVTKYDAGVNESMMPWTSNTQVIGRGNGGSIGHLIFKINSSRSELSDADGSYCLENQADALPTLAATSECAVFEYDHAWDSLEFPFSIDLTSDFESKLLFENDDLIENDGSDFEIPTYSTLASDTE